MTFFNFLKRLSIEHSLNIFSDAYPEFELDKSKYKMEEFFSPVSELSSLIEECALWGRSYWQEGDTGNDILFLRSDWYNIYDRGEMLKLIFKLAKKKTNNIPFSLEDWGVIYNIDASKSNYIYKGLGIEPEYLQAQNDVLRFYVSLNHEEKRRLLLNGLDWNGITTIQKALFADMVISQNANLSQELYTKLRLTMQLHKENYTEFVIKLGETIVCDWNIKGGPE